MSSRDQKEIEQLISQGFKEAESMGEPLVGPEHLFLSLIKLKNQFLSNYSEWQYENLVAAVERIDADRIASNWIDQLFDNCLLWISTWPGGPPVQGGSRFHAIFRSAKARRKVCNRQAFLTDDFVHALLQDRKDNLRLHEALRNLGVDLRDLQNSFYASIKGM